MSDKRVDYDRIAPTYNRRFQGGNTHGVAVALSTLARELGAGRILEVGCGTGRWLADLRSITNQLYGLDFSGGMLAGARERDEQLRLVRGQAAQLPFPVASFDLVYCVNAMHHFEQQRAFVFEARRLLRSGGALAVVGTDPRGRRDHWYIHRFFEGTFETDLDRFASQETVLDWITAAGLKDVSRKVVERIHDPKVGRAVLDDPFLQKDAVSQLALLTDDEYAAGLRRIQAALDAAEAQGEQLVFRSDITLRMFVGRLE